MGEPRSNRRGWPALVSLALAASLLVPPGSAQDVELPDRLRLALDAVVPLRAVVPAEARTAPFLGTERRGTGLVIDGNGLVLTIGYLVLEAERVEIAVDGQMVESDVVAYDYGSGLGLVRARSALAVRPLALGDSSRLGPASPVLIAGFGDDPTLQPALVVSRRDFAGYWEYLLEEAIFTSPPHPAFAGAALLGPRAELLGVGYLFVADAGTGETRLPGNMFVPIDRLKPILGEMLVAGRAEEPSRPWLGIYTEDLQGRLFVRRVASGGPAAAAGIEPGDFILGVGDDPVSSLIDLYRRVWAYGEAGAEVPLVILRDEGIERRTVRSGDRYDWLLSHPSRR